MITYPEGEPAVRRADGKLQIFCSMRKRWITGTPEEWVRQNLLRYFIEILKYPASLIAVEKKVLVNGQSQRFDMLVHNRNASAWMVVECKNSGEKIAEKTLMQALRYVQVLRPQYFLLSNGLQHFLFDLQDGEPQMINEFPVLN